MSDNMKSHREKVLDTKTRKTRSGTTIQVGTAFITILDPSKVEEVRERFENHEKTKFR